MFFLGYELGADGRTCVDVDECDFLNGGCDQVKDKTNNSIFLKFSILNEIKCVNYFNCGK